MSYETFFKHFRSNVMISPFDLTLCNRAVCLYDTRARLEFQTRCNLYISVGSRKETNDVVEVKNTNEFILNTQRFRAQHIMQLA